MSEQTGESPFRHNFKRWVLHTRWGHRWWKPGSYDPPAGPEPKEPGTIEKIKSVSWWVWRLVAALIGLVICIVFQLGWIGAVVVVAWFFWELVTRIRLPGRGKSKLRQRAEGALQPQGTGPIGGPVETEAETEEVAEKGKGILGWLWLAIKILVFLVIAVGLVYYLDLIGVAIAVVISIAMLKGARAKTKKEGKGKKYDQRSSLRTEAKEYPWLAKSKWHAWWLWRSGGWKQALTYLRWTRFYMSKDMIVQEIDPPGWIGVEDRLPTTMLKSLKDETGNVQIEAKRPGGFSQYFTKGAGELVFRTGGEIESLRLKNPEWARDELLKLCDEVKAKKGTNARASQQSEFLGVIEKAADAFGRAIGKALRGEPEQKNEKSGE